MAAIEQVFLYMTVEEAERLADGLASLLADPERVDHVHVKEDNGSRQVSLCLVTQSKLQQATRFSKVERALFQGSWNW